MFIFKHSGFEVQIDIAAIMRASALLLVLML